MTQTNNLKQKLQQDLKQHFQRTPNQLQNFLKQLSFDSNIFHLCSIIIELMYSSKYQKQRLQSATSLNYLIDQCFKNIQQNLCSVNKGQFYEMYRYLIATRNPSSSNHEEELEEWKLAKITFKNFQLMLQTFQQDQFTPYMQQIYPNLNLSHKILLQNFVTTGEIQLKARDFFLEETLINYLGLGIQQMQQINELNENQRLKIMQNRFREYLTNLHKTLKILQIQTQQNNSLKNFYKEIFEKQEIFKFIHQCITLQFNTQKTTIILFNCKGNSNQQQIVNKIKALGLQIFIVILSFYNNKSLDQQFYSSQFLTLMETIVPQIIDQLSNIKPNQLCLDYNQNLTIAALKTIQKSLSFIFMNNELIKRNKEIFWKIIYPLLSATSEELRSYEDKSQILIAQIQSLIEMEEDNQNRIQSCKTYAGSLLQKIVSVIDVSLPFIFQGIIAIMEAEINQNSNQITKQIQKVYGAKLSLQTCFTVISILWNPIKKRTDLTKQIRQFFYTYQSELLSLREIQKVRLLSYLTYNFELIFSDFPHSKQITYSPRTNQYYIMISNSIQQNEMIMKCCLQFIDNKYEIQPKAFQMIQRIFQLIEHTKKLQIFEFILKILKIQIPKIKFQHIIHILTKFIKRIFNENQHYIKALQNQQIYSALIIIKCLQSISEIVKYYTKYQITQKSQQIMGAAWKIFDLMENIPKANYAEELIEILNHMLLSLKTINRPDFFQFLPFFESYHLNCHQLGNIFETYNILMSKGKDYLKNTKEGNAFINHITANTCICLNSRYIEASYISITLLQYIFVFFPEVNIDHGYVFNVTKQIFNEKKSELNEQKQSSIFNLWIIGSTLSDQYDLSGFDNLNLKGIYGYHAKVFTLSINLKVKFLIYEIKASLSEQKIEENIIKIGYLLEKTIQLIKIYNNQNRRLEIENEQIIQNFTNINPYNQIQQTLTIIQNHLNNQHYQHILKQIQKHIHIQCLQQLLTNPQVHQMTTFK